MTWLIVLADPSEDITRWTPRTDRYGVLPGDLANLKGNTPFLLKGGESVRIVRTDRWQHDERVVSLLRSLQARGLEITDPTGLLGGSRDGPRPKPPEGTPPRKKRRNGLDLETF